METYITAIHESFLNSNWIPILKFYVHTVDVRFPHIDISYYLRHPMMYNLPGTGRHEIWPVADWCLPEMPDMIFKFIRHYIYLYIIYTALYVNIQKQGLSPEWVDIAHMFIDISLTALLVYAIFHPVSPFSSVRSIYHRLPCWYRPLGKIWSFSELVPS